LKFIAFIPPIQGTIFFGKFPFVIDNPVGRETKTRNWEMGLVLFVSKFFRQIIQFSWNPVDFKMIFRNLIASSKTTEPLDIYWKLMFSSSTYY